MARSRSPSLSFEPTPAITLEKEKFLLSDKAIGTTSTNSLGRNIKELHFTSIDPTARRAQSLATTAPLLKPISSASQVPRQNHCYNNGISSIDIEAYIQQSRALLQTQRLNFERERKLFDEERKLWNAERGLLKTKIVNLEATVTKNKGEQRKYSNENKKPSSQSFPSSFNSTGGSTVLSRSNTSPPIWEGPEHLTPASRVFSEPHTLIANPSADEQTKPLNDHLPSISENGSYLALDREISPSSVPPEPVMSVSIPIDKIDKSLDGITLKSTALAPSFITRVMTPEVMTPQRSPSPNSKTADTEGLRAGIDGLLSPLDENLKLHAGHTPIAFGTGNSTGPTSLQSTEISTPVQERPLAPVTTACRSRPRPAERSDSYFSATADIEQEHKGNIEGEEKENEDLGLNEPLALSRNNEHGQSDDFLNTLDAKLMAEAKRYVKSPESTRSDDNVISGASNGPQDDDGPRLRMKKSINFGSAFGSNRCGQI